MSVLDPYCQVRIGGLDYSHASELLDPTLADHVSQVREAYARLQAHAEDISDLLYPLIGGAEASTKTGLINVRRHLYNGKYAQAWERLEELDETSRESGRDALGSFATDLQTFITGLDYVRKHFDDALAAEREKLVAHVANPLFMAGIAVSSPSLVPALLRLTSHVNKGKVDKKDRKAERSLQSYVLRAATKTSPFSTLGPIAIGYTRQAEVEQSHRSVSLPSLYPVVRALHALAEDPKNLAGFEVRVSDYVRGTDGVVSVDRTQWDFKDASTRTDYAKPTESNVIINQRPLVDAVYQILGGALMTFGELNDELSRQSGIPTETTLELLADLMRLGYLHVPALSIHPHDAPRIDGVVDEVRQAHPELGCLIAQFVERSRSFSRLEDPRMRQREIGDIQELVASIYSLAGVDGDIPRSVLYEDVVAGGFTGSELAQLELSDSEVSEIFLLLDLLDDSHVKSALMEGYFDSRQRLEISATDFIDGFIDELFDSFEAYDLGGIADDDLPDDPWLRWGEAWRWVLARRRFVDHLSRYVATHPRGSHAANLRDVGAVDISEALAQAAAILQRPQHAFRHANILIQFDGEAGSVILNDAFGGIGFQISRFTHLLDEPAHEYLADVERLAKSKGVRLVELSGGALFSNLNLHEPLFSTSLVLPGEPVSSRDVPAIRLEDLVVTKRNGVLVLTDGCEDIHPVYAGYLVPAATPRRSQVVSLFAPSAQISRKLTSLVTTTPGIETIAVIPRLTLGRIVVARARAIMATDALPTDSPLEAGGYLAWLRFWADNGLPERCFVKIIDEAVQAEKPSYFDIRSVISCSTLLNDVKNAEGKAYVEVAEVLPASPTATHDGRSVVNEYMLGISLMGGSDA